MTLVSLEQILHEREKRVAEQCRLLKKYNVPLICFTLNIAGNQKNSPLIQKLFAEGKKIILNQLIVSRYSMIYTNDFVSKAGNCAFFAVKTDLLPEPFLQLKNVLCQIEDANELNRLFDIDVLIPEFDDYNQPKKISRIDIGKTARPCLLCKNEASFCIRNKTHSTNEVIKKTHQIINDYFINQTAQNLAQCAVRALFYELSVTPKAGLVDRANSGSHTDMDFFTFIDSTTSLFAYFKECALIGLNSQGESMSDFFEKIRYCGKNAEMTMFCATNGTNTHKGAIFSLGICSAAVAYQMQNNDVTLTKILQCCAKIAQESLKDFEKLQKNQNESEKSNTENTNGEKVFYSYGLQGIRLEAALGFPLAAKNTILLQKLIKAGVCVNTAGVIVFLHFLSELEDTNIVHRSSYSELKNIQKKAAAICAEFDFTNPATYERLLEKAKELDSELIHKKISPGGCADMLSLSFFLLFVLQLPDQQ